MRDRRDQPTGGPRHCGSSTSNRSRRRSHWFDRLERRDLLANVFDPIGENPITPHPVAGQAFVNALVATFTSFGPLTFRSATIDWGDGHATPGTVLQTGPITYEVLGSHTYTTATIAGSPENVTVTINDPTDSPTSPPGVIRSTAVVDDAPIANLAGVAFTALQGIATSTQQDVATFGSGNPYAPASSFTASIDWGDSTPIAAGQVVEDAGKVFHVEASHSYAASGHFPVSVAILSSGGSSATTSPPGLASVITSAVDIAPIGVTTRAGGDFAGPVASFAPPPGAPVLPASDYLATISWGDGTAPIQGSITPSGNSFVISGAHTYATAGVFPIGVTVRNLVTDVISQGLTQATVSPAISTPGPRVTDVSFDRLGGRIIVTLASGLGLNQSSVTDAANYVVSKLNTKPVTTYLVTGIQTSGDGVTAPEAVVVSINHNRPLKGGFYTLTIKSGPSGIVDLAGRQLEGTFYGSFPSGNGRTSGDFTARLISFHRTTLPPMTLIGTSHPVASPAAIHAAGLATAARARPLYVLPRARRGPHISVT